MFETLSRRSTSLIDQQLSLIERLESDEEDPKRLQSLFRLDHLAARMRRNSDSLLVLAGTSTRRGVSGSVSVSDAVRAAVSEVENYERIDIGDTSNDHVLGAVGSDLIHLVAEIVDNALSYSPPTSRVAIRGARTPEGGLLIEVSDRGLGMPPKDLAVLNDQLAHGGDITADTARRMGLFVVGSLAKRHGIAVRLRRNGDDKQGITVSVHLPAGLLADSSRADRPARPTAAAPSTAAEVATAPTMTPTSAVGGTTKAGLPTRVRGASGATPSPVPGAAKKVLPTRTPGAHGPTAGGGLPAPVKPVIEGADTPVEQKAPTNGKAAEDHVRNGSEAQAGPHLNGAAAKTEKPAIAEDVVMDALVGTEAVGEARADVPETDAPNVEAAKAGEPQVDSARTDSSRTDAPGTDATGEPQRSAAGLPVRKPRATGITEYREFEDAPSTAQDTDPSNAGTGSDAPAAKAGRLSWLPGRKAAAEAARAEAAADESRQMPSNLSAWLDHRAKLVEAAKARDLGADAPTSTQDESASRSSEAQTDGATGSATDMHVPEQWVAEVVDGEAAAGHAALTGEQAASAGSEQAATEGELTPVSDLALAADDVAVTVDDADMPVTVDDADMPVTVDGFAVAEAPASEDTAPLPTRIPGATSALTVQAPTEGVPAGRPALRAHNTSFFGARRARGVGEGAGEGAAQPEHPTPADEITDEVTDEISAEVTDEISAEVTTEVTAEVSAEVTTDVTDEAAAPGPFLAEAPQPNVDAVVEESGTQHEWAVETVAHSPATSTATAVDPPVDPQGQGDADDVHAEPAETPRGDLNDTPIFRAMMSRWLTDDSGAAPASTSWSTNEADRAWSAAARIEETQPLEESAAGLPKRRPGNYLIPGAIEESDEKPAAPAASRRDPEAIRRNLNRHKNGVSSARTEAQDGTHREEADVHH
jgi:hypothetical protein